MLGAVIVAAVAVFFAGMGFFALAAPGRLLAPFDITLGSATARSEVRAVYGGFGLAMAAVLVTALAEPDLRAGVLLTVAAALAGMALGRVASLLDARTAFYPNWFYLVVEVGASAALMLAYADPTG